MFGRMPGSTHLDGSHGLRLANHAQLVLLFTFHVVVALLPCGPYGSGNTLAACTSRLGRDRCDTSFGMRLGVGDLTFAVAVVGLLASTAFRQAMVVLAAVEAFEDRDPHGFHVAAGFLLRSRRRGLGVVRSRGWVGSGLRRKS